MEILGDGTFFKWTGKSDFPSEYETTLTLQYPFHIRYIFGAWNVEEIAVDGVTIVDKNDFAWKSENPNGLRAKFHILPIPALGTSIALKLSKSEGQYISRLSIGGCQEGKIILFRLLKV